VKRKGLSVLLITIMTIMLSCANTVFAAEGSNITIVVNGIEMEFLHEQPVIREGRTFVPSNFTFFDIFGFTFQPISYFALKYEPENFIGRVQFYDHRHRFNFLLFMGDYEMILWSIDSNREIFTVQLDVAPFFYDDGTERSASMLPLRAIAEAAGFTVHWDGATRTIVITD